MIAECALDRVRHFESVGVDLRITSSASETISRETFKEKAIRRTDSSPVGSDRSSDRRAASRRPSAFFGRVRSAKSAHRSKGGSLHCFWVVIVELAELQSERSENAIGDRFSLMQISQVATDFH